MPRLQAHLRRLQVRRVVVERLPDGRVRMRIMWTCQYCYAQNDKDYFTCQNCGRGKH